MAISPLCAICNGAAESCRYSLIECNMAKCVWALVEDELTKLLLSDQSGDRSIWLANIIVSGSDQFVKILVTL